MNYFKGSGMGFVNKKQNHIVVKKSPTNLKHIEAESVIAGNQISDLNSLFNELYRFHD